MAINTITYSTKSNSYSKPNTPQKSGSASKTNATSRSSTTSSVKVTSSAPKRDTFTYSSQPAKSNSSSAKVTTTSQTSSASKANTTTKQSTSTKTSTSKANTSAKTSTASTTSTSKANTSAKQSTSTKTSTSKANTSAKPSTASTTLTSKANTTAKQSASTKTSTSKVNTSAKQNPSSKTNVTSNELTNQEYNKLAAKLAGVSLDKNGNPLCTSYEQCMKYGQTLSNLHKSGINKNSTPQEIAAAGVGTTIDKNGRPNISSTLQGQNYGKALGNITAYNRTNTNNSVNTNATNKKTTTVVKEVETKPITAKVSETKTNTISSNYTQKEIEKMEKDYGTKYVWEHVYKKKSDEYNYLQRAEDICGFKVSRIANKEMAAQFNAALNGTEVNSSNTRYDVKSVDLGVGFTDTDAMLAGTIYTDNNVTIGLFDAPKYTVVAGDGVNKAGTYVISEAEREHLIYLVLHEAAGRLELDNPEAQAVALASTFLNMYETDGRDTFAESLAYGCYKYGKDENGYMQNTLQPKVAEGDYSGLDISYWKQYPQLVENATNAVDTVLGGTRTTNATQWHGEKKLEWKYNRFTDSKDVPGLTHIG